MTSRQVPCNPEVVGHLLSRFQFRNYTDLQAALGVLTRCVLSSMQAPAAYALPLDQKLPDEMGPEGSFTTVHPQNVATALVSVALAGPRLGGDNLSLDPSLQLWIGDWTLFSDLGWAPVPITVAAAPTPAPAPTVPAGPAIAPAPATGSVMDLVNAALSDAVDEVLAEDPALAPGPPGPPAAGPPAPPRKPAAPPAVAPSTIPANPTVTTAPPPPRPAAGASKASPPPVVRHIPVGEVDLPDPSVIVPRTGASGRPQASPFTKKVEPRTKVGDPPFWWGFMIYAAERILTQPPPQALDPDSQGSGPVQAYSLLLHLLHDKVLAGVDPYQTVAALRTYLKEVIANIDSLPSADAVNQLADTMLGESEVAAEEQEEKETE